MALRLVILSIILFAISACSTTYKHKSFTLADEPHVLGGVNIWVSKDFKVTGSTEESLSVFVKHLLIRKSYAEPDGPNNYIERDVADYFLIVNGAASQNKLDLFGSDLRASKILDAGQEIIEGVKFITETKAFNTVQSGKGGYYGIIAQGSYSPPDCGIVKKYASINSELTVSFIDAVSCGQLRLEASHKEYKKQFKERIKKFKSLVAESFGVIRKNS